MEPNKNPEMTIVNASQLINILQEKDDFGRPICSIVMFYSPNCVFSKRVAGYVYLLAKLFPQLQVYAINIHKRSPLLDQMINQHGIGKIYLLFMGLTLQFSRYSYCFSVWKQNCQNSSLRRELFSSFVGRNHFEPNWLEVTDWHKAERFVYIWL